jgi:hypothetical protein
MDIKESLLKIVTEAIEIAKNPAVQADAKQIVTDHLAEFESLIPVVEDKVIPVVGKEVNSGNLKQFIPNIFCFCSGIFAGAFIMLFILAAKAGLL